MRIVARGKRWVIEYGSTAPDVGESDPYDTRAEARADMQGLARFERFGDRPGFVGTEPRKRRRETG